jgi:hypothetical protein
MQTRGVHKQRISVVGDKLFCMCEVAPPQLSTCMFEAELTADMKHIVKLRPTPQKRSFPALSLYPSFPCPLPLFMMTGSPRSGPVLTKTSWTAAQLLLSLICGFILVHPLTATCYWPDGSVANNVYVPCNSNLPVGVASMCYESFNPDVCRPDGLVADGQTIFRGPCTDPDFSSLGCADICPCALLSTPFSMSYFLFVFRDIS